jgi:hypothetical protein
MPQPSNQEFKLGHYRQELASILPSQTVAVSPTQTGGSALQGSLAAIGQKHWRSPE